MNYIHILLNIQIFIGWKMESFGSVCVWSSKFWGVRILLSTGLNKLIVSNNAQTILEMGGSWSHSLNFMAIMPWIKVLHIECLHFETESMPIHFHFVHVACHLLHHFSSQWYIYCKQNQISLKSVISIIRSNPFKWARSQRLKLGRFSENVHFNRGPCVRISPAVIMWWRMESVFIPKCSVISPHW